LLVMKSHAGLCQIGKAEGAQTKTTMLMHTDDIMYIFVTLSLLINLSWVK